MATVPERSPSTTEPPAVPVDLAAAAGEALDAQGVPR